MQHQDPIERIRSERARLDAFGVKSLSLFGSYARGTATGESDVDILVRFNGPTTSDQYMDLEFLLEDLLGLRVDLVTEKGLRSEIRPRVEAELLRVV